jgi:hypothetical protein
MLANLALNLENGTKRSPSSSSDEKLYLKRQRIAFPTSNGYNISTRNSATRARNSDDAKEESLSSMAANTQASISGDSQPASVAVFTSIPSTPDNCHPILGKLFIQNRCQSHRAKLSNFPQCMACTARQSTSGGCKFASLRAFPINPQIGGADVEKPVFLDSAPFTGRNQREAERSGKIEYSTPGSVDDIGFIRSSIADTLDSIVQRELEYEGAFHEKLIRRRREAGVRPVCDGCATTIFSGHFMCCVCGRELCLDCYYEWDESVGKGFENVDSCLRRQRHSKIQMIPFTFARDGKMQRILDDVRNMSKQVTEEIFEKKDFAKSQTEGFLPFIKTDYHSISEDDFRHVWSFGRPLVVAGCLEKFAIPWTPQYFMEEYGQQRCLLVDCNTEKHINSTVEKFFNDFLTSDTKQALKLKVSR